MGTHTVLTTIGILNRTMSTRGHKRLLFGQILRSQNPAGVMQGAAPALGTISSPLQSIKGKTELRQLRQGPGHLCSRTKAPTATPQRGVLPPPPPTFLPRRREYPPPCAAQGRGRYNLADNSVLSARAVSPAQPSPASASPAAPAPPAGERQRRPRPYCACSGRPRLRPAAAPFILREN